MTSFDFNKRVIEESYKQPVIVEFSSPGCGPCLWMEKTLVEVVREMQKEVHLVSIPVSDYPECVNKYKISSNPTTMIFIKGEPVATINGALPKMAVRQWIEDYI